MTGNDQIWKSVLKDIKPMVSEGQFNSLLKPQSLISIDEETATIGVSNAMVMGMLQSRFASIIKNSLSKQLNKNLNIVFILKSPEKNQSQENLGPLFVPENKTQVIRHLPRVRPDYTFETLAVSGSNQLAVASAQRVAEGLGKSYNPLFIYGPVGVGKTHLMQAIANEVYRKNPNAKIIYITSEEFTNEVVEAIRSNDTGKMKKRFRSADLLIIDDVQFIAGKDKVQEELFHTFNTLIDNGSQIVLSSDKPPSEIKKLEARLSSRFAGGLTVDVEAPNFEMRTAILLKKAEKIGFPLSIDVAKVIAEKEQDVRSLEGTLLKLITKADMTKEAVNPNFASKTVGIIKNEEKIATHPDDVIKTICNYYGVKSTQLKGPKREASLVKARQVAMYVLKIELKLTLVEIGNLLGGRDHTTIIHGVEKMGKLFTEDNNFHEEILGITKSLRG